VQCKQHKSRGHDTKTVYNKEHIQFKEKFWCKLKTVNHSKPETVLGQQEYHTVATETITV